MEPIIMKILCSGNPDHTTVASAVKKCFSAADFASRATGYDLRFWNPGSEEHFRKQIKNYTVFINSSFICGGGQLQLLEVTYQEWRLAGITGHIINIGSSAEWLGYDSPYGEYSIQKRALRDRSLQLNGKHGINTTHITVGGINDGKPGHEGWLNLKYVAESIEWAISRPYRVPLLSLIK
jgi:hypothetical protein